jgi:hypothetical protein
MSFKIDPQADGAAQKLVIALQHSFIRPLDLMC